MLHHVVSRVHEMFNNRRLRSLLRKLRYAIFLVAIVVLIPQIEPSWFLPGFVMCLFGESIQLWCFACLDKNTALAVKGPYTLMRNPMYIGRFFLLLGGLLLTGNSWIIIVFTLLYYFYMVNRVRREEGKLRVIFGEAYEDYCKAVNRFVPNFIGIDSPSLRFFKWRLLLKNNGHWNLFAVLMAFVVFYFVTFIYSSS